MVIYFNILKDKIYVEKVKKKKARICGGSVFVVFVGILLSRVYILEENKRKELVFLLKL